MARLIALARWIVATDPRTNARRFLFLGLGYALLGGLMALNLRWSIARTGQPSPVLGTLLYPRTHGIIGPSEYATLFTTHGAVMIFFAATPLLHGFLGNLLVPRAAGTHRFAVPSLSPLSYWLTFAGGAVLVTGMYARWGGPSAGWSAYAPLSTRVGSPGPGITYWCVAMMLAGTGTVAGAINVVATVVRSRVAGVTLAQLPLVVWGLALAALLNVLFTPVLLAATALLAFERSTGRAVFSAGMAAGEGAWGDPLLWQHLFWLFGHPEVYVLILPVWGALGDLFAHHAGRARSFGHRTAAAAMSTVVLLAATVYGHHMFTAGIGRASAQAFMALTVAISVPSAVLVLTWLGTLFRGALRFEAPMLYALGAMLVFVVGGLSGMYLGVLGADVYLHETWFVVGHFHFVMAASVLLGAFASLHHWFPSAFPGRALSDRVGRLHAVLTTVLLCAVFGGMLAVGWSGALRRMYDPGSYAYARGLHPLHDAITGFAFVLVAVQALFVSDLVRALRRTPHGPIEPVAVVAPVERGERVFAAQIALASMAMAIGSVGLARSVLGEHAQDARATVTPAIEARALEPIASTGAMLDGSMVSRATLERGRDAYVVHCVGCHGPRGEGDGVSARGLRPRPRDLRLGTLACTAVVPGALARREDVRDAIVHGRDGTAMRGWDVPPGQLDPLVDYVRWLSPRARTGERAGAPVYLGPDPWRGHEADALTRGRALYHAPSACTTCHPSYLAATAPAFAAPSAVPAAPSAVPAAPSAVPAAPSAVPAVLARIVPQHDERGERVLPTDFTLGEPAHCGATLAETVRTLVAGRGDGTMPPLARTVPLRDAWALAYYVRSLAPAP